MGMNSGLNQTVQNQSQRNNSKPKLKSRFYNSLHKKVGFKHALEWLGLFVPRDEILAWVGGPEKANYTDSKSIRCQILDGPHRDTFVEKI